MPVGLQIGFIRNPVFEIVVDLVVILGIRVCEALFLIGGQGLIDLINEAAYG